MYPVTSTSNDYQSNDPYRCMPAGADAKTYATIASFLSTKKLSGNTALKDFTCGYGYTTRVPLSEIPPDLPLRAGLSAEVTVDVR